MELSERLLDVLRSSRGVEESAGTIKIPAESEVEVYINTGMSLMTITKVSEIRVEKTLWSIRESKGDVSYFASDRISGVKIKDSEIRKKEGERGTGFTRGL